MAGILGGFDPKTLGLLMAGSNMLQASGPSLQPRSLGQIMGTGLMGGLQGFGMGQQFQAMQEQADLRKAQADKLRADALREARLRSLLEGGDAPAVPSPQPITEPSLGGPVTSFPVGLKTVESRPVDAPAPAAPSQMDVLRSKGQRLIEAGFINEGGQLLNAAATLKSSQDGPHSDLGKLAADLASGRITKEQFDDKYKKLIAPPQPVVQINPLQDNLGLKPRDRFEMEGKLRDDFRGNPTVKAADEMESAFRLIETAYQRPSAANDLAMATKYMKILDPTSVVRESELALAMSATGLLDRVQNYANLILKGEKLNPQQREDFYKSASAINDAFQRERDTIAKRFSENASQYNLSPENVVGKPRQRRSTSERTVLRRGTLNGRRVVEYSDGVVEYE